MCVHNHRSRYIKCVAKGSPKVCTKAKLYSDILRVCLDAPNCKSVETGDFVDSKSWIGEATRPLLFDREPKPAAAAMINEMLKK